MQANVVILQILHRNAKRVVKCNLQRGQREYSLLSCMIFGGRNMVFEIILKLLGATNRFGAGIFAEQSQKTTAVISGVGQTGNAPRTNIAGRAWTPMNMKHQGESENQYRPTLL